jgi:hypothetical protein
MDTEIQKPFITIDGVQISIEDLPEEGQAIFGRIQRENTKRVTQTLDLEATQAAISWFTDRIVTIINKEGEKGSKAEKDKAES